MEINNSSGINSTNSTQNSNKSAIKTSTSESFASQLKTAKNSQDTAKAEDDNKTETEDTKKDSAKEIKDGETEDVDNAIDGLKEAVDEMNKQKPDEKSKNEKDLKVIDNNMNLQEQAEMLNLQMGANMNFNSDNQQFAEFLNQENSKNKLRATAKDLAEEKAIMHTMEENLAMINKSQALKDKQSTVTIHNDEGIKKVDSQTNLTVETIVSYDNVVMDKADVDFFVNLVDNGSVEMNEVQNTKKSAQVSKTLADLLAKSMNDNKPVRIDFDNNISVIIKISKSGKISADFLPSSQIAEAYLKENLPILKQRFDDKNIDYDELNQRKQQKQDTQDNKKKGRKDE